MKAGALRPMLSAMQAVERIRSYLMDVAPNAVCDYCVEFRVARHLFEPVGDVMRDLAGSNLISRGPGRCHGCGERRTVTRHA